MVFILLTVVFIVLRIMPGDPVLAIVGAKAPPHVVEELRHQLGLDQPLYIQYISYLSSLLRGDFGTSLIWGRRPVLDEILEHFPATLELTMSAMMITLPIGIVTGVQSAYKRNKPIDYSFRLYGTVIYSIPIFWLGMILQLIFGVYLGWLPIYGRSDPFMAPATITGLYILDSILTGNILSLIDSLEHLILPSSTLGLVLSGIFTRLTRVNMLEVLRQDFITAAKARGLLEKTILYKHALKNAMIPIVTMMGLQFALLLAGAVLTETTFSWPGMGTYLVERIDHRDFPAIQGAIVFYALIVVAMSVIVDIIYAYLDPRIRY
jgi:peptide/nickel transport system permease protein